MVLPQGKTTNGKYLLVPADSTLANYLQNDFLENLYYRRIICAAVCNCLTRYISCYSERRLKTSQMTFHDFSMVFTYHRLENFKAAKSVKDAIIEIYENSLPF